MSHRPYQTALDAKVDAAYAQGARNVVMVLSTGGGKTKMIAKRHREHNGASCVIAHRNELVSQLSMALANEGLHHNIIAAKDTRAAIAREHMEEIGRCYYTPGARCAVAGIDTLIRAPDLASWAAQVTLWTTDEGHHLVADNKWHTGIDLFTHPSCRGLLPTATPSRADGKGLGRHADGIADAMVEGPPMRWLIDQGYLTDYRIVCPTSDIAAILAATDVGASGDYSPKQLREAAKRSHIVGDVVQEYRRFAEGLLGVTFMGDVDTATETAEAYRAAGVPAAVLTGKTDAGVRRNLLKRFRRREILQLVAVDIISEGFDLPAMQVVSFGRKTESLAVYMQQFGRDLRPIYAPGFDLDDQYGRLAAIAASDKPKAIVIDQVGNVVRHRAPDMPRVWTLDSREGRRGASTGIPLRVCLGTHEAPGCMQPYERFHVACPYCGATPAPPATRTSPAMVDGDLVELDASVLATLRGVADAAWLDVDSYRVQQTLARSPHVAANVARHREALDARRELRETMDAWAGHYHAAGETDREIQRRFWFTFGVDVLSAVALGRADAEILRERIDAA